MSDWPSAVMGTIVAIAGMGFGWWTAVTSNRHSRTLADEQRRQDRLANAYIELLMLVWRASAWAEALRPVLTGPNPLPPPPLPGLDEQVHVGGLVDAFGSRTVADLLVAWRATIEDIVQADVNIAGETDHPDATATGTEQLDRLGRLYRHLNGELRPAERSARQALTLAVRRELGSPES